MRWRLLVRPVISLTLQRGWRPWRGGRPTVRGHCSRSRPPRPLLLGGAIGAEQGRLSRALGPGAHFGAAKGAASEGLAEGRDAGRRSATSVLPFGRRVPIPPPVGKASLRFQTREALRGEAGHQLGASGAGASTRPWPTPGPARGIRAPPSPGGAAEDGVRPPRAPAGRGAGARASAPLFDGLQAVEHLALLEGLGRSLQLLPLLLSRHHPLLLPEQLLLAGCRVPPDAVATAVTTAFATGLVRRRACPPPCAGRLPHPAERNRRHTPLLPHQPPPPPTCATAQMLLSKVAPQLVERLSLDGVKRDAGVRGSGVSPEAAYPAPGRTARSGEG